MKRHKFDIEDKKLAIKKEILRISAQLNKTPTRRDYKKCNKISPVMYLFGSWSEAIKFSGLTPNFSQNPPRPPEISKESLIQEFIRVSNAIEKIPGMDVFCSKAKYSPGPYKRKWGSWRKAVDYIVQNYKNEFIFPPNYQKASKNTESKNKKLSYACPLQFEPRNEYETIVLFAYLAKELGYKIKEIKSSFPDAVLEINGKEILSEFEFLSSNYREHCHPDDKKYLCICWRKDKELEKTSIFSLEEYIRNKNT